MGHQCVDGTCFTTASTLSCSHNDVAATTSSHPRESISFQSGVTQILTAAESACKPGKLVYLMATMVVAVVMVGGESGGMLRYEFRCIGKTLCQGVQNTCS